jgi:hypothetical protein
VSSRKSKIASVWLAKLAKQIMLPALVAQVWRHELKERDLGACFLAVSFDISSTLIPIAQAPASKSSLGLLS